jgi:diguanylate cyclase (GGDEF)-like protein
MNPSSTPAEDEHREGGVVVPLHGGREQPPASKTPPTWRIFDPEASRDALTSLHGHPWFEEGVRGAAKRRRAGENPWLAIARVDGMEQIDASHGAETAGEALAAVALRLRDSLRAGDKIARIGSDTFGLIVDAPYAGEAIGALERIERTVRELTAAHPQWVGLSLRMGLTPLWGANPEAAIRQAEGALDAAVSRGAPVMMSTDPHP